MDKHYGKTFQEMINLQLKISSLFEDLLLESYRCKLNCDNLKKNSEEVSMKAKNLKEQNEKLQKENRELKNAINEFTKAFSYFDFSKTDLVKDLKPVVETLKRVLIPSISVIPEPVDMNVAVKDETCTEGNVTEQGNLTDERNDGTRYKINQDNIEKEIDAIKDLKFTEQFFDDIKTGKEKELMISKSESAMVLKKLFDRKLIKMMENLENPFCVRETEPFDPIDGTSLLGPEVQETVDPLSEVINPEKQLLNSPVFKSFGRRQDNVSTEENHVDGSKVQLVREKLFQKPSDLVKTPQKKPNVGNSVSPKRLVSSPKRTRKKLKIDSPKKSPVNQLKKSNDREAEMSASGFRKLTQTLLNIECFKKKFPEVRKNDESVGNKRAETIVAGKTEAVVDTEEDDFIMESPKKSEQVLECVKIKKETGACLNEIPYMTPPSTSNVDLDETYVSSSMIKKCKMTGKYTMEKIYEDQTPGKQPIRERSPDGDSVPFVYKREAVRSKGERMKLPGHACLECNKYYKNALGEDISPRKLKEILNKCSRHRDKNSPTQDNTPAGYWKPYLTTSIMTSYIDDETVMQ